MGEQVTIEFGEFAWARLKGEAVKQEVSVESLVRHAVLYFLADVDSGRIARQVPRERPADAGENTHQT